MKILLIARTCPYPANDGEKIRVFNLIKSLSHHDITLVCRAMSEEDLNGVAELERYCSTVRAFHIPSPVTFWERLKWVMPFLFSKYPISLSTVYFLEISQYLQKICRENKFDIIQVEHSSLTIYLDHIKMEAMTASIVIMHNIDYIRNERVIKNLPFGLKKIFHLFNQSKFKKWEIRALHQYNCIATMSDIDKSILEKDTMGLNFQVLPNGVDTKTIKFKFNDTDKANNHIVFVASMDSDANHDGAIFFIEKIFGIIKKQVPEANISFVGRNPRKGLLEKHNGRDIIVTGMVESVLEYYEQATVVVVPLRSGGGTRLKILEAVAAGVPVVSTSVGAEGLNLIDKKEILIADTPQDFANCVLQLLGSGPLRKQIALNGRKKVENEYDWSIIAQKSDIIYHSINPEAEPRI